MDEDGKEKPLIMGCYGVGVSRSLAAVVEQHNDEHGIVWPVSVAPYEVAVIPLDPKKEECATVCEQIVDGLCAEGIEVVVDDRDERPGFKFADNDLMGFPFQVVLGKRGLKNGTVELKDRATGEREDVAIDEVVAKVAALVKAARRESTISLVVRYTGRPRISPDRGDAGPSFYLVASSISKRKTPQPMRAAGFSLCLRCEINRSDITDNRRRRSSSSGTHRSRCAYERARKRRRCSSTDARPAWACRRGRSRAPGRPRPDPCC